jgi:perosamine synthetase
MVKDKKITHARPTLGKEEEEAVLRVIRTGQIAQGPKVREFEEAVAAYVGRKYAVAVSSGLAALHLALLGLGITAGEEVIIPSYTCDALLQAINYVRATPVIVDVNYEDGNISLDSCLKALSQNTRAVILTHNFGFPADITEFLKLNIPLIEDCAIGLGGSYKGKKLGYFGKVSIFSFYATKMIATGEGGMILTDDEGIANEAREMRDYTGNLTYRQRYNYKMSDLEAAIGISQLIKLNRFVEKRRKLFAKYFKLLARRDDIVLPGYSFQDEDMLPSFYRFVIKLQRAYPLEVLEKMKEKGIMCGRGVLQPLHRLMKLDPNKFPNAEKLFTQGLSLPLYPSLNFKDVEHIIHELNHILNRENIAKGITDSWQGRNDRVTEDVI